MTTEADCVLEIWEKIGKARELPEKLSEADTQAYFVEPWLEKIAGWHLTQLGVVQREWRRRRSDDPTDYALFADPTMSKPSLLVEAKALDAHLSDKSVTQLLKYASSAGVRWCVLTNGDEICIYNSQADEVAEEKEFIRLRFSDPQTEKNPEGFARKLHYISPRDISEQVIDAEWESARLQRKVENALSSLLKAPSEEVTALVQAKCGTHYDTDEIAQAIKKVARQFPTVTGGEGALPRQTTTHRRIRRGGPRITLAEIVQKGLIRPGATLRATLKGREYQAEVQASGVILCDGKEFSTPSAAGQAVCGYGCDGWLFWRYQDKKTGKWTLLDELRKQFRNLST